MNIAGIITTDIANGPGIRTSIFVSGCRKHCPGCHNQKMWDFGYGVPFSGTVRLKIMASLLPKWVSGLSVLGGEPFEEENKAALIAFIRGLKAQEWFRGKDIWIWTGKSVYETMDSPLGLTECADYLVDGEYKESARDPSLAYRGSQNQRIFTMRNGLLTDVTSEF